MKRREANEGTIQEIKETLQELDKPSMALLPPPVQYPAILQANTTFSSLKSSSATLNTTYTSRPILGLFSASTSNPFLVSTSSHPTPSASTSHWLSGATVPFATESNIDIDIGHSQAGQSTMTMTNLGLMAANFADSSPGINESSQVLQDPTKTATALEAILNDPTLLTISDDLSKDFEGRQLTVIDNEEEIQDRELVSFITKVSNLAANTAKANNNLLDTAAPLMVTDLEDIIPDSTFDTVDI